MKPNHINQLEHNIEKLVEGVFNQLFRRGVSAHDIALSIARAMEANLKMQAGDSRAVAPDVYRIHLNPHALEQLSRRDDVHEQLSQHIVELAMASGYQLLDAPDVQMQANTRLKVHEVAVDAKHSSRMREQTAAMQAISLEKSEHPKTQLVIDGTRTVWLDKTLITIGRATDNDVVIDDAYISRYHLQLRSRDGTYVLFDVQSRSGTLVNNVTVREHRLQAGDVIKIGESRLVYMTDDYPDDEPPSTTSSIDAVEL